MGQYGSLSCVPTPFVCLTNHRSFNSFRKNKKTYSYKEVLSFIFPSSRYTTTHSLYFFISPSAITPKLWWLYQSNVCLRSSHSLSFSFSVFMSLCLSVSLSLYIHIYITSKVTVTIFNSDKILFMNYKPKM